VLAQLPVRGEGLPGDGDGDGDGPSAGPHRSARPGVASAGVAARAAALEAAR